MFTVRALVVALAVSMLVGSAQAQPDTQTQSINERTGTVVAAGYTTLVVRSESNQFNLFILDRQTQKPSVWGRWCACAQGPEMNLEPELPKW